MHWRAQISASVTSRSQNSLRSPGSPGTFSGDTETRTWCTHDLGILRDLVSLLAHDRDFAGLGHEQLSELLELGRGCVASREDAEVDPDLEACGLVLLGEGDDILDLHHKPYYQPGPCLTLSRLPAESAQCNSHAEQPPAH